MIKYLVILVAITTFTACKTTHTIVDKPITFDAERKQLTLDNLKSHYDLEQKEPTIVPKMIVLHWTVIPTFDTSFETFDPTTLPGRPDLQAASSLNVSSQFMVDRDGTIYRLLPETTMARHVIGLNHCAIGIENVGGGKDLPLTKAQREANIFLVRYLAEKYDIEYVLGHYEYTKFEDHPLWLEKDDGYRTIKTDPGEDFMRAVRKATKDLHLKSLPYVLLKHS